MISNPEKEIHRNQPLVSIGVPVYNGAEHIIEALESISKQIYLNFECHIINNASKDNTRKLVEEFIENKNDKRFFLHNYDEFADIISNWNRTVTHIVPEAVYFKVVQADDVIFPNAISTMVDLLEQYPSAGIGSAYRMVGTFPYGFGISYFDGFCQHGKDVLRKHLNNKAEITGSITQLIFRISELKKVQGYPQVFNPEEYHIDTRLAYEMFYISDLVFAFEALSFTRRHDGAETTTTVNKFNTLLHGKESRLSRFKPFYPEIEKHYQQTRRKYAYFILKQKLAGNKACIKWHDKFLKRKFTMREYLQGILHESKLSAIFPFRYK